MVTGTNPGGVWTTVGAVVGGTAGGGPGFAEVAWLVLAKLFCETVALLVVTAGAVGLKTCCWL